LDVGRIEVLTSNVVIMFSNYTLDCYCRWTSDIGKTICNRRTTGMESHSLQMRLLNVNHNHQFSHSKMIWIRQLLLMHKECHNRPCIEPVSVYIESYKLGWMAFPTVDHMQKN